MFEKPVDLNLYRDYLQYVRVPLCLEQVERKVRSGLYITPEDFEYDVYLIFKNCEAYNAPKKSDHMIALGKNAAKMFKKICINRFNVWENPEQYAPPPTEQRKRAPTPADDADQPVAKKAKADAPTGVTKSSSIGKTASVGKMASIGKSAPRISITAAAVAAAAAAAVQKKAGGAPKSNVPLPLHVAIAQIKEGFPLR